MNEPADLHDDRPQAPVKAHPEAARSSTTTKKGVPPEEIRNKIVSLHAQGYGTRAIAERVPFGRKVVRRVLAEEGIQGRAAATKTSLLTPYLEAIEKKVRDGLTVTRIKREIATEGYRGGRTILAEHVRKLRTQLAIERPAKKVTPRFETPLGLEAQADWSSVTVSIGGHPVGVHILAVLLCACRKLFVAFFRSERQHVLLEGLARAFEYFDGAARRLVVDNMAAAVLGRVGPRREPLWHPRFLAFCRHYGTEPFACKPRSPNRKGADEKVIRLVKDDFFKGRAFPSWNALQEEGAIWLDHTPEAGNLRIHGTTRERPNDAFQAEREFLIRLPEERFPVFKDEIRIVDQDSTLSILGTRYTVPAHLANRSVPVRLFANHFEVLDRNSHVAFSHTFPEPADKGKLVIDPTHYATLRNRSREGGTGHRLDEAFLMRFPSLQAFIDGLKRKAKGLAYVHIRKLITLAERFGDDEFVAVLTHLNSYKRFDALAAENLLEKRNPMVPEHNDVPLAGIDLDAVASVDEGSIDSLADLDEAPATPQPDEPDEEDPHGA